MSEDTGTYSSGHRSASDHRPSGHRPSSPPLVHFNGAISSEDRDRIERALQRVEKTLTLPRVPVEAGAAWVVVASAGLLIASRLGLKGAFTALSTGGLIAQLDASSASGATERARNH
jgi:hypothetical protein